MNTKNYVKIYLVNSLYLVPKDLATQELIAVEEKINGNNPELELEYAEYIALLNILDNSEVILLK